MKVLQVNNVYADKSTGKITKVIHDGLLADGWESVVVYGRGRTVNEPGVIRLCPNWYGKANNFLSRLTGMPYGGCLLSTWRLQRIIDREKPDVVHLQCINGYFVNIYRLIEWLKKRKIKTVVSLHAEFMYTANCGHAFECEQWKKGCKKCPNARKAVKSWFFDRTGRSWQRMKKAFSGFEKDCIICPVSPWTQQRAMQADILKDFTFKTVYNGIDAVGTFNRDQSREPEHAAIHVTAHFNTDADHAKGGYYVAQLARRMKDVTFYVAGRADANLDLPENVKILGHLQDQQALAQLYRRGKVTVLTSKRETFSMPCAESLCCGTPVVGFKAGAPEMIAMKGYSSFVEFGDLDGLEKAVRQQLDAQPDRDAMAAQAAKVYGAQAMVSKFERVYKESHETEAD